MRSVAPLELDFDVEDALRQVVDRGAENDLWLLDEKGDNLFQYNVAEAVA